MAAVKISTQRGTIGKLEAGLAEAQAELEVARQAERGLKEELE
jgi:hypothetical protein